MKFYSYRIRRFVDVTNPESKWNNTTYLLMAEVVVKDKEGSRGEKPVIQQIEFEVSCSGDIRANWGLHKQPQKLHKVLYEFGRIYLEEQLRAGKTNEYLKN